MSFKSASGTNFLIRGERPSVRLPSRMVPICVRDPTGCALPLRTSSTPAIKVVLTAPIPGRRIPNFPVAGALFESLFMPLPLFNHPQPHHQKIKPRQEFTAPKRAPPPKQPHNSTHTPG